MRTRVAPVESEFWDVPTFHLAREGHHSPAFQVQQPVHSSISHWMATGRPSIQPLMSSSLEAQKTANSKMAAPPASPSASFCATQLLALLALVAVMLHPIEALQCFECFDQLQPCTPSSNCTGSACVIYENMPNRTSVAFCLLATAERADTQPMQGCWRDGDTGGVECLCTRDFCNARRDLWSSDPNSPPIPGLKMLDRNPFVDYEYLDEEKAVQQADTKNDIAELEDAELPAGGEDQDLMPKDLEEYLDWEARTRGRNQTPKEETAAVNGSEPERPAITSSDVPSSTLSPAHELTVDSDALLPLSIQTVDNGTAPEESAVAAARQFRPFGFLPLISLVFLLTLLKFSFPIYCF